MKCLILGLGFIAANLAEFLRRQDLDVYVTYRETKRPDKLLMMKLLKNENVKLIRLDKFIEDTLANILREVNPDVIYNLIGKVSGKDEEIWFANAIVPEILAKTLMKVNIDPILIHVSAAYATGLSRKLIINNTIIEEKEHCCSEYINPKTIFERSKCEGEKALMKYHRDYGLKTVILRPTLVYGNYNTHEEWVRIYHLLRRGVIPMINIEISAIYVGYLVDIMYRATSCRACIGEYMYVSEEGMYRFSDFIEAMAHLMNVKGFKISIGKSMLKFIQVLMPKSLRMFIKYVGYRYSTEKMYKLLGVRVRDGLEKGMYELTNWLMRIYG